MKIPRRAHLSAASSLPLSVSLARAARVVAGVHPWLPRHVPVIVESRAASSFSLRPSPYPRRGRSRSPPQTLAPSIAAGPSFRRRPPP